MMTATFNPARSDLRRAALMNPSDALGWLAMADWCEEQGQTEWASTYRDVAFRVGPGKGFPSDPFTVEYLQGIIEGEMDDDGRPLARDYSWTDMDMSATDRSIVECAEFYHLASGLTDDDGVPVVETHAAMAGWHFYCSRQGHGTGFWCGHRGEHCDALHEIAQMFGEIDVCVDDDGVIHIS